MMASLKILFNAVRKKSEELNKKYRDRFDGLGFWQPIKKELAVLDNHVVTWKSLGKKLTHEIMSIPEYTKNGYGDECMIESHHFVIQQVRIPTNEKANPKKIIQVGLNIGQWKGRPDIVLRRRIKYSTLHLDKIDRYISKSDIEKLSKKIPKSVVDAVLQYLSTIS